MDITALKQLVEYFLPVTSHLNGYCLKKGPRNTFGYAILIAKKWLAIRKDKKNECWYQNSIPEKLNDFNIGNFVADQEDKYKETATVYFVKRRKVTTTKVNIKI